jgi:hypothetical protein
MPFRLLFSFRRGLASVPVAAAYLFLVRSMFVCDADPFLFTNCVVFLIADAYLVVLWYLTIKRGRLVFLWLLVAANVIFVFVAALSLITACDKEDFLVAVGVDRYYTLLRILYVVQATACIAAVIAYSLVARRLVKQAEDEKTRT